LLGTGPGAAVPRGAGERGPRSGGVSSLVVALALGDSRHGHDLLVPAVQRDEPDALRGASDDADLTDGHANQDAGIGDQHHLVVVAHLGDAGDLAVALGGPDGDQALPAPALEPMFGLEGALAVAVLGDREDGGARFEHVGRDHAVAGLEGDASHPPRIAAHGADVALVEADRHAVGGADEDVGGAVGEHGGHQLVALVDPQGEDSAGADVGEGHQVRLLHHAVAGDHEDEVALFEAANRKHAREFFALLELDEVDDGPPEGLAAGERDLVNLEPVEAAEVGEEEEVVVGAGHEERLDEVLLARPGPGLPSATAALRAVLADGVPLDVAVVAEGDDHVLFGDEVLAGELALLLADLGAARIGELRLDLLELLLDHAHEDFAAAEDLAV